MNKVKHLEMIENVIARMGHNSFQLKNWAVAIISIIGTLSIKESDKRFILLSFIPLLAFWLMDAFYLQCERKYKHLYEQVRKKDEKDIDYCMSIADIQIKGTRMEYWKCICSKTELLFYFPLLLSVIVLMVIIKVL